jgi:hypothetical protein
MPHVQGDFTIMSISRNTNAAFIGFHSLTVRFQAAIRMPYRAKSRWISGQRESNPHGQLGRLELYH